MSKLLVAVFLLLTSCVSSTFRSVSDPELVKTICIEKRSLPVAPADQKLADLLLQVQERFDNLEKRMQDQQGYLHELDQVIEASRFRYLLACTKDWNARPGHFFKVEFTDPDKKKPMSVDWRVDRSPEGQPRVTLALLLTPEKSVQRGLVAYMHELVHVCQSPAFEKQLIADNALFDKLTDAEKWTLLRETEGSKDEHPGWQPVRTEALLRAQQSRESLHRLTYLREVDAYVAMMEIFNSFIRVSPRFCFDEPAVRQLAKQPLAEIYIAMEAEYTQGRFAQRAVEWHRGYFPNSGVFQPDSPVGVYPASILGPKFAMPRFHPEFAGAVKALGIPLREQ